MRKAVLFAIFMSVHQLVWPGHAAARSTVEDFQTWGMIIITGSVAPSSQTWKLFRYWMEGQGRFGNDSSRFSQAVIRSALGYAVNDRTSLWLGGDWVPTSRPFALRDDFNEYRSWQQVLWSDHLSFGTVSSRSRFEQRLFDIPDTESVGHRYCQLLKLSIPLPLIFPDVSLVLADEIFVNLIHADATSIRQGFDQNRAIAGFAYRIDRTTVVEIAYMNQYLSQQKGDSSAGPDAARPVDHDILQLLTGSRCCSPARRTAKL